MWLPKGRLFYLSVIFLLVLLTVLTTMAEDTSDTEDQGSVRGGGKKREGRKRKGRKNKDRDGTRRRKKHKHKKQPRDPVLDLPTTTLASLMSGLHPNSGYEADDEYQGLAQPLVRDLSASLPLMNGTADIVGSEHARRRKLRPSVMQREMKFSTVHGNRTWPQRELVSVIEGNITLGGLMMVHERDEEMICGKIMPQGGLQVRTASVLLCTISVKSSQGGKFNSAKVNKNVSALLRRKKVCSLGSKLRPWVRFLLSPTLSSGP